MPITYSQIGTLVLVVEDHGDTVNIESTDLFTTKTQVNTGAGANIVAVCPTTKLLDRLLGPLDIEGGDGFNQLIINDQNNNTPYGHGHRNDVYTVRGNKVSRTAAFLG